MWKRVKEVLLSKPNNLYYTNVKAYIVISLLNCLGKVSEKVVADMLVEWYEVNHLLHSSQIGSRKQRRTFDARVRVVSRVQEAWR